MRVVSRSVHRSSPFSRLGEGRRVRSFWSRCISRPLSPSRHAAAIDQESPFVACREEIALGAEFQCFLLLQIKMPAERNTMSGRRTGNGAETLKSVRENRG